MRFNPEIKSQFLSFLLAGSILGRVIINYLLREMWQIESFNVRGYFVSWANRRVLKRSAKISNKASTYYLDHFPICI